MASIVLTDEEWQVLANEPHHLLKLYVELRRRMDFDSRIVGSYTRLSEQAIKEALYVTPKPGRRDSGYPTRKALRHALDALEALGLIVPQPAVGPMVWELPFAYSRQSDQNQRGLNGATKGPVIGPQLGQEKTNGGAGLWVIEGGKGANSFSGAPPQSGLPPISDTRTTAVPANNAHAPANHVEWQDWFTKNGFSLDQVMKPNVIVGLQEWVRQGVTLADAEMCVAYADSKCSNGKPASPAYYLKFMPEVLRAKENPMRAPTSASGFVNQPRKAANNNRKVRNDDFNSKRYVGTPVEDIDWMR